MTCPDPYFLAHRRSQADLRAAPSTQTNPIAIGKAIEITGLLPATNGHREARFRVQDECPFRSAGLKTIWEVGFTTMKADRSQSILPTSGQILGLIVKAFRLHDAEIGGRASEMLNSTSDKTAQRLFSGTRIDHQTADAIIRQFGKALFHSRLVGEFEGAVEAEDGPIGWETVFERAASHLSKAWDHELWQSAAMFPRADKRLATLIFARHVIIELALRHACLVLMGKCEAPDLECPWWATDGHLGTRLKALKGACAPGLSGSAIASALDVDDSTVDRWLSGREIPNLVHTDGLARLFASHIPESEEEHLLRRLRAGAGIASLVNRLRQVVGQDAVTRLGEMHVRFVRWTIELAADDASTDPLAQSLFAGIMVLGTAHPSNGPVLLEWAQRVREIPWADDILKSHPVDRATRVKESLRVVGEAEKRQADLQEVLPDQPTEVREMISEAAAWNAIATPMVTPEQLAKIQSGEHKVVRIPAQSPAHAAENRMAQALQAERERDFETACKHACRAVYLQPDRADYCYFYGCFLWQAKRFSEGIDQLRKACEMKPEWDRPFVEIAIANINWGRMDMALFHLEQGPESMRNSSDFYLFTLARIYRAQKAVDRALEHSERAVALNPDYGEAFDLAADCAFVLGDRRKGARYAKEAKHRGVFATFARWQDGFYGPA